MTKLRPYLILCVLMLSACAGMQKKTAFASKAVDAQNHPCTQKFKYSKDGTQFENPSLAVEVLSACEKSAKNAPAGYRAANLKMRSIAYAQLKNYGAAIADSEEALRLVPAKTAWDVIQLASLYRESGQAEKALVSLRQMLNDHLGMAGKGTTPGMPSYYHLGRTLVVLERWPEAAEAFSEGLKYQGDYSWAYLYRALSYDHMNVTDQARDDVKKARSLILELKSDDRAKALEILQEPPFSALIAKYPE
jgi:tetratricopeptide (TPR) repeat protein